MSLKSGNTQWVLFLSASHEPEVRHILDLAFGLHCLEAAGISPSNIFLYIDGADRTNIEALISSATQNKYAIKESCAFFTDLASNAYENLVMFVTGHGSLHGIDAPNPIKPHQLIRSLKDAPILKQAVVYFGQCHAGIFNYIGAGRKSDGEPNVILIGATNLNESLSVSTKETLVSGEVAWQANLFLLFVFKWISAPHDVDGDGALTAIDSYKFAGVHANDFNKRSKAGTFVELLKLHERWVRANAAHQAIQSKQTDLLLRAAVSQYEKALSVHHVHQDCWILNAIPAQSLQF